MENEQVVEKMVEAVTPSNATEPVAKEADDVVSAAKARGYLTQAQEQKAKAEELAAKLEKFETAERERERVELESKAKYDEALAKERERSDALEAKFAELAAKREADSLGIALMEQGVTNSFTRQGIISDFLGKPAETRGEFSEYLTGLKKSEPSIFTATKAVVTGSVGTVSTTVNGTTYTPADLKDPTKAAAASKWVSDYVVEHGEFPQGF